MDNLFNVSYEITSQIKETQDDFIFTTLSNFLQERFEIVIPKELVVCAISEFYQNHSDLADDMIRKAIERVERSKE